ncbi:xanthine dehydrogenase accessory protein XdhC [Dongia soli]|uniref:Xanthine dehydrogenase accessory protein XdhC n=1 Tax=Dongia soli TaxID=600628 RepID=A0ABU5E5R2_9PROT|nr:xanthine dehydrogenase accessory protein XdhC [Dongia soli]MDY0881610.1 xanthine dehydrogenase accessory protein XdhC [Dongia soli]
MMLWSTILRAIETEGRCALVSVVKVDGSSPREVGARMIVRQDDIAGTIGGGSLEWQAMIAARELLPAGAAHRQTTHALGPDLGQCCGGRVELVTEVFDASSLSTVREFAERERKGTFTATGRIGNADFIETFGRKARPLLLFGAGHVGRALISALAPLPFEIAWIDSRTDIFPAEMPSNVMPLRRGDPVGALAGAEFGSFVLVMTHSHALDFEIVESALRDRRFAYIGLIGSATKRARFISRLRAAKVPDDRIDALICPIGLPGLQSKEPAVIAAATAAQLLLADEALHPVMPRSKTAVLRDACCGGDGSPFCAPCAESANAMIRPATRGAKAVR